MSASTRGTKGMPREQREQRVLQAATEEFGAAGFAAASLSRIGERAGVSKAMVLSYFRSKEELYAACVQTVGERLAAHIEPTLDVPGPPTVMAQATLSAIFMALEGCPSDWNLLIDRSTPRGGPAHTAARQARATIAAQASAGVAVVEGLETLADRDDRELFTAVWMNAVAAIVGWWLDHPERGSAEMAGRTERLLASLVGASGPD